MLLPIIAVDPDDTPVREQEASHQHLRKKSGRPGNSGAEPSRSRCAVVRRTASGSVRKVGPHRAGAPWNAIAISRPGTAPRALLSSATNSPSSPTEWVTRHAVT